jgi:hypothetical protein
MLREITRITQVDGDPKRRWFLDEDFDLLVWLNEKDAIIGFQLCYDKSSYQRAVTWEADTGFQHNRVDDGENRPGRYKSAPILVMDGYFENRLIAELFKKSSEKIDEKIAAFVYEKLLEYPNEE